MDRARFDALGELARVANRIAFLEAAFGATQSLVDFQNRGGFDAVSGLVDILTETRQAAQRAERHLMARDPLI
jgi:hypothetical protein